MDMQDLWKEVEIIRQGGVPRNHLKVDYGLCVGKLTWGNFAFIFPVDARLYRRTSFHVQKKKKIVRVFIEGITIY